MAANKKAATKKKAATEPTSPREFLPPDVVRPARTAEQITAAQPFGFDYPAPASGAPPFLEPGVQRHRRMLMRCLGTS